MDDLISKQDALALVRDVCDAIMSCCGSHYDEETEDEVYDDIREVDAILKCNKEIRIALKNLPSAQQWIPCSERLPHMWDERYLVSLAWGGVGVMEFKSTGFHNYGSFSPVPIESVIAWMPLPEPYKERREE